MRTISVFLEIAKNEGISVSELAQKCGIASSSATRNVQALSDWHWQKKPGLGLINREEDPMDQRRTIAKLTPKGKMVVNQIVAVMGS